MNFQEKVYNQVSRDRLELCRGGGCISIFGIPFFLAGLFTLGIGLRIIPVSNAAELPWWAWFVVLGMGLVFTGVGSAMVFGRNWITIDKTQRRIWFAYGLLRPMRGKSYDLGDYSAIILSRNAGDSDTSDTFPVSLVNANRGSDLEVFSSVSYGVSRKQAELLLRFLGFALTDQTTGTELVQKARDDSDRKELIPMTKPVGSYIPEKLRSKISQTENGLQILMPGKETGYSGILNLIIPALFLFIFIRASGIGSLLFSAQTPSGVQIFFGGFVGVFFVLIPLISAFKRMHLANKTHTIVTISPHEIVLERLLGMNKGKTVMSRDQIVSLDYLSGVDTLRKTTDNTGQMVMNHNIPLWLEKFAHRKRNRAIMIKSHQGLYRTGDELKADEVEYLYAVIYTYIQENW